MARSNGALRALTPVINEKNYFQLPNFPNEKIF